MSSMAAAVSSPSRARNLALFDFDGTITERDTFVEFVRFATSRKRMLAGQLALSPLILGYRLGAIAARSIRAAIAWVAFGGVSVDKLERLGGEFARDKIPSLVRASAQEQIDWHLSQGDRVVVVSASLDVYLAAWCKQVGLELICTRLARSRGRFTGRYVQGDCSGPEKRDRILAHYNINDYATIYAYGDTAEDEDMLSLADRKFFCWSERRI